MPRREHVVALLGDTGRLGPSTARAFADCTLRGLSRRDPLPAEDLPAALAHTRAERRDVMALRRLIDGATVVIDLLGFDAGDADALLDAIDGAAQPPRHLIFASSIAEDPALVHGHETPDGRGKRSARARYEARFAGAVHTLLLPRLVARVDPSQRERAYLDAARATGRALLQGDGRQRQTIAPVDGVAATIRALANDPTTLPPGAHLIGPAHPVTVAESVRALLRGAAVRADIGRHPDPRWRGPHGGGDEVLDVTAAPGVHWPDVLDTYAQLGAWMAAQPAPRRPLPVVAPAARRYTGARTVDVHDRRARPPLQAQHPAIERLAAWLTPSFYIDLGRPCNAACVYCSVPPHGDTEGFTPVARVIDMVKAGLAAGCDRAILIGGEPTIHPEVLTVLEMLTDAGLPRRHVVMTNGLKLADPKFLDALIDRGVATLHVSVDTDNEAVHDRIARSHGQFQKQRLGLRNALARKDLNVYVYTVLTRWNADGATHHLASLAALARELRRDPPTVVAAFTKPIGDALTNADALMLSPAERTALARALVAAGDAAGVDVGLRNLQPCLAPELAPRLVDLYLDDVSVDLRSRARTTYAHNAEYLRRVPACASCALSGACPGVYAEDIARYGGDGYAPVTATGEAQRSP
jgi:MoaA/NifB/PqqE/SkfB family radical SAM enzyme